MKRVIYVPSIDELIPDTAISYRLPVAGVDVVDVICDDAHATYGTVYYDSLDGPALTEPFVHHFAGWEP